MGVISCKSRGKVVMMSEEIYRKICSIRKDDNNWELLDCEGNILRTPDRKSFFPSSMNKRYRSKRKEYIDYEDESCVWVLIGQNSSSENWIQVGSTKSLKNLLSNDIKEDIKEFYSEEGKYANLSKKYEELTFYEVDVEKFLKKDKNAKNILGEKPKDKNLALAYSFICAAYIEGKLSFENNPELYHPSTLDGYYHAYFRDRANYEEDIRI